MYSISCSFTQPVPITAASAVMQVWKFLSYALLIYHSDKVEGGPCVIYACGDELAEASNAAVRQDKPRGSHSLYVAVIVLCLTCRQGNVFRVR